MPVEEAEPEQVTLTAQQEELCERSSVDFTEERIGSSLRPMIAVGNVPATIWRR
jgi:hypothetical protein